MMSALRIARSLFGSQEEFTEWLFSDLDRQPEKKPVAPKRRRYQLRYELGKAEYTAAKAVAFIANNPGCTANDIMTGLATSYQYTHTLCRKLEADKRIVRQGYPRRHYVVGSKPGRIEDIEAKLLVFIAANPGCAAKDIVASFAITNTHARKLCRALVAANKIVRKGCYPYCYYLPESIPGRREHKGKLSPAVRASIINDPRLYSEIATAHGITRGGVQYHKRLAGEHRSPRAWNKGKSALNGDQAQLRSLTVEQVRQIVADDRSIRKLAVVYNVSSGAIQYHKMQAKIKSLQQQSITAHNTQEM